MSFFSNLSFDLAFMQKPDALRTLEGYGCKNPEQEYDANSENIASFEPVRVAKKKKKSKLFTQSKG